MAVSDIVGGNAFDVLFVAVADLAFLDGSIYAAVGPQAAFLAALAVLLNVVVLLGLLQRQPQGPGGIGFESVLVLVLYAGGLALLALGP
jgi:cation:H+ antiporter